MTRLAFTQPFHPVHRPPTGTEERVDVRHVGFISMSPSLLNKKDPTLVCFWPTSPLFVGPTPPSSPRTISNNPAPAVPAAHDFCSASPAGPSLLGEPQATPWFDRRFQANHIFPVNRTQGVALLFLPTAESPCCPTDASLHSHCTTGGHLNRWTHRSHHRPGHSRLQRRATC